MATTRAPEQDPVAVLDLALGALVRRDTSLAMLERAGEHYLLTLRRGPRTLRSLTIQSAVAACAVARLARMTGLDPLAHAGTPEGHANVARLRIRAGEHHAELIVSIAVRCDAFEVEVRAVTVDGRDVEMTASALRRCPTCGTLAVPPDELCLRDGSKLQDVEDDPRPGGTLGVYRIDEELGHGGMGTVLGGVHAFLDRPVAIKVLHQGIASHVQQARAFLAEARAASRVRDARLVEAFDYGVLADGRPYVVMERLEGQTLTELMDRGVPQPAAALRIARELAHALSAAHAAGVVHNDMKPSNVMLLTGSTAAEPRVKVMDFGAASLLQDGSNSRRDFVVGTPHYMSPEQIGGRPTDARSDVYALGIVIHELLTGEVPFDGDSVEDIFRAHLTKSPTIVTSAHGVLPGAVTHLVARALSKSPAERHQSAGELAADVEGALATLERSSWARWLR